MMKPSAQFTSIGGQAVIEGVMMRSPHFIAVAVRKSDKKILIRNASYSSVSARFPFLKRPILRGILTLIESMIQGVDSLGYSANIAAQAELLEASNQSGEKLKPPEELTKLAIAGSLFTAFFLGMGLFVALPHLLTVWATSSERLNLTAQSPIFHLLDGSLKMMILLCYVYLIAMMKDVYRVFQYHGAEHKSIYAFEAGEELTVENARKHSTLHPRCGTSFLLFLVLISVAVFSVVFPSFHLTELAANPILNHLSMILIKMILMLPVAGLAYEFIKACAFRMDNPIFRLLIWPGMVLQKLTTREPTDDQLEVALASLKQVLQLEKKEATAKLEHPEPSSKKEYTEIEICTLADLAWVRAEVSEFPEN